MTLRINGATVINTDRSITLGTATPSTPVVGMMRYNSTLPEFQVYDGYQWGPVKKDAQNVNLLSWGAAFGLEQLTTPTIYSTLGDNAPTTRSSPASVAQFTDWTSVSITSGATASAGLVHALGLRANGTLWSWGRNSQGQLGNGNDTTSGVPVPVAGGFTDWVNGSATAGGSIGVRANGTLWSWGGVTNSPNLFAGGFVDWVSASAGGDVSVGLRANGTLWTWGAGYFGSLGNNSTTPSLTSPVAVAGGIVNWTQASAGWGFVIGRRTDGTLWSWGKNYSGEAGNYSAGTGRSSPTIVVGGIVNWENISCGASHSIGARANGSLWAWGGNTYGQLGNNSTTVRSSPVSVVGGFTDWVSASAGNVHSLGVRANGSLWAWGSSSTQYYFGPGGGFEPIIQGFTGALGDGGVNAVTSSPVSVIGGFTDWVSAEAGHGISFGIRA